MVAGNRTERSDWITLRFGRSLYFVALPTAVHRMLASGRGGEEGGNGTALSSTRIGCLSSWQDRIVCDLTLR